ncbi:hypothetical protein FRC10_012235, partial [Ceratobasidium sp. 414]
MEPPAELLASEDEDDDGKAIGTKPGDNVAGESRAQPATTQSNRSPKRLTLSTHTTPARSPTAPSPKQKLVPVLSLPTRPRLKTKVKVPAVVEATVNKSEDDDKSADDGKKPRKKAGWTGCNDSGGKEDGGEGRKPTPKPAATHKLSRLVRTRIGTNISGESGGVIDH